MISQLQLPYTFLPQREMDIHKCYHLLEGTKRSVYLRESPKMMEEPRIEIVR